MWVGRPSGYNEFRKPGENTRGSQSATWAVEHRLIAVPRNPYLVFPARRRIQIAQDIGRVGGGGIKRRRLGLGSGRGQTKTKTRRG